MYIPAIHTKFVLPLKNDSSTQLWKLVDSDLFKDFPLGSMKGKVRSEEGIQNRMLSRPQMCKEASTSILGFIFVPKCHLVSYSGRRSKLCGIRLWKSIVPG